MRIQHDLNIKRVNLKLMWFLVSDFFSHGFHELTRIGQSDGCNDNCKSDHSDHSDHSDKSDHKTPPLKAGLQNQPTQLQHQ